MGGFNGFGGFGGMGCGGDKGGFDCNCLIWILLLTSCCGCDMDCCDLILILLLLNCCGGKDKPYHQCK
ncbi:MAG: hypothetical protein WC292_04145 [Clostridia bacterium]